MTSSSSATGVTTAAAARARRSATFGFRSAFSAVTGAPTAAADDAPFSSRCSGCQARVARVSGGQRQEAEHHRARDADVLRHVDGEQAREPSHERARACSRRRSGPRPSPGPSSRGGRARSAPRPDISNAARFMSSEPSRSNPASASAKPSSGSAERADAQRVPQAAPRQSPTGPVMGTGMSVRPRKRPRPAPRPRRGAGDLCRRSAGSWWSCAPRCRAAGIMLEDTRRTLTWLR